MNQSKSYINGRCFCTGSIPIPTMFSDSGVLLSRTSFHLCSFNTDSRPSSLIICDVLHQFVARVEEITSCKGGNIRTKSLQLSVCSAFPGVASPSQVESGSTYLLAADYLVSL